MNRPSLSPETRRTSIAGAMGLGLGLALMLPLARQAWMRPAAPMLAAPGEPFSLRARRGPSEAARRTGWWYRVRAQLAVNRGREALEAWDPRPLAAVDPEVWRLQQLAADPTGDLRRARAQAERAAAWARTPDEQCEAALLRAQIEHDAGRRQVELRQAQALMAMAPRNPVSRACLRRARRSRCLRSLAQRATAPCEGTPYR